VRFIGLDVHKDFCEVAVAEGAACFSGPRVPSTPEDLEVFGHSLGPDDHVVLEATGGALAIARILERHTGRVVMANPMAVRAIASAKAKTDLDARTLARLLQAGFPPAVWMGDERTRLLRRLVSRHAQLVKQRTQAKNQIHAVLQRTLKGRPPASDLFGKRGRAWLDEQDLPADERETVQAALRHVDFLDGADPAEQLVLLEPRLVAHTVRDQARERERTPDPRTARPRPRSKARTAWPTPTGSTRPQHSLGPPRRGRRASARTPRRRPRPPAPPASRSGAAPTARGRRRRRRPGTTSRIRSAAPRSHPIAPSRSHGPDAARRTRPERATPRASGHEPTVDTEVLAQPLDVRDRFDVVLLLRSTSGSLAWGVLRPQFRWSNRTIRYASGSNGRGCHDVQPEPGPPCRPTTAFPTGLPHVSQYTRWPVAHGEHPALARPDLWVRIAD
jgi:Transposase